MRLGYYREGRKRYEENKEIIVNHFNNKDEVVKELALALERALGNLQNRLPVAKDLILSRCVKSSELAGICLVSHKRMEEVDIGN